MFVKVRWICSFIFLHNILLFASLIAKILAEQTENGVTPPIEFPKNESTYPFRHNQTILRALASHTTNDTEVDDLRHGGQLLNIQNQKMPPLNNNIENMRQSQEIEDPKSQVEEIEDDHGREVNKVNDASKSVPIKPDRNNRQLHGTKMPIVQGQLAAILAGSFVAVAVVGYIGMLSWRRFFENRYGNREMLVNEEDFCDPNDMRHFSL